MAVALACSLLAVWWAGTVSASGELGPETPRAVAAEEHGPDPEANLPFLFAVYIITWGGFFAYVFVMSRRQREMQRELDALKAAIADRESEGRAGQAR